MKILIYRGDSKELPFYLIDENDTPIDLTNLTAILTVKEHDIDNNYIIKKTITPIPNPTLGVLMFYIEPIESELLTSLEYDYDIELSNSTRTYVRTIVKSKIIPMEDVTRPTDII